MERRSYRNCHVHDSNCDLLENDLDSYCPYVGLSVLAGYYCASDTVWARYLCCDLAPEGTGAHPRCSER